MSPTIIHHRDPELWVASWRNIQISSLTATMSLRNVNSIRPFTQKILAEYPAGYANVALANRAVGMPTSETRARAAELMEQDKNVTLAFATILEGDGFWSSASRTAMAGLLLLARTSYPHKVFRTPDETASWLAPLLKHGTPSDVAELTAALIDVRKQHLAATGS